MAHSLQVHRPQSLNLSQYERVWWDPAQQHFVLMNKGTFQALCAGPDPRRGAGVAAGGFTTVRARCTVEKGRRAKLAKYSLDMKLLAVQISDTTLVVVDIQQGRDWRIDCKGGGGDDSNELLRSAFIWSEHGGNSQDLVLVTRRGAVKLADFGIATRLSSSLSYPPRESNPLSPDPLGLVP